MVESSPAPPFIMGEPELLLKLLIIPLDSPAQLGEIDQPIEREVVREGGQPVFAWFGVALRPFDQQPFFGSALLQPVIAMRGARAASHSAS